MIYLDNAATTKVDERVIKKIEECFREDYGNPSSLNRMGFLSEEKVKECTDYILKALRADSDDNIIWTSGGTESNNMALKGIAEKMVRTGKHIITSKIEHASILNVCKYLSDKGYEIEYLDVDDKGHVDIEKLKNMIRKDTILVSIMHVNNEIGSINDLEIIGKIIKEKNNNTIFHVDSIQGFGKVALDVKKMNIDLLSTSGHKVHGPKGIGFLYIKKGVLIPAMFLGGGQQDGYRSGTVNVPGIVGMTEAIKIIFEDYDNIQRHLYDISNHMKEKLKDTDFLILGGEAPHILSIVFPDVRAEVMLHSLEEEDIYVGAGSACSSHEKHISQTLSNIGLKKDYYDKAVRFSFSRFNTLEEIDKTVDIIKEKYAILSRFVRK